MHPYLAAPQAFGCSSISGSSPFGRWARLFPLCGGPISEERALLLGMPAAQRVTCKYMPYPSTYPLSTHSLLLCQRGLAALPDFASGCLVLERCAASPERPPWPRKPSRPRTSAPVISSLKPRPAPPWLWAGPAQSNPTCIAADWSPWHQEPRSLPALGLCAAPPGPLAVDAQPLAKADTLSLLVPAPNRPHRGRAPAPAAGGAWRGRGRRP
ncbi:MAG: hypothetical protein J3K34DRAFT_25594 [Monoraphidium minutum]|nr:MAG: hypothetical protein J3K34DRAFT_25594 [Monoraphidium minutum]